MNTPTPAYMKGYFKDAAELEKQKYIFQGALNETNNKISQIRAEKEKNENQKMTFENQLLNIDHKYTTEDHDLKEKKKISKTTKLKFGALKRLAKLAVIIGGILLAILFIATQGNENNPLFLLFVLLVYIEAGAVALLIISNIKTNKAKDFLQHAETRDLILEKTNEQNTLSTNLKTCKERLIQLNEAENSLNSMSSDLTKHYSALKNALTSLYAKNLISPIYHNFTAMATFYHYLSTGRCLEVFGPGGVIDTYERDLQFKEAYSMITSIRDIAVDNNILMSEIKDEAVLANQKLTTISKSLKGIEFSNASIAASNREIANYCAESSKTLKAIYASY